MFVKIKENIKLLIYCFFMKKIWSLSYNIFNWAEDRRPSGGFHIKNFPKKREV